MKWNNLKSNKCPKCALTLYEAGGLHICPNPDHKFTISKEKFDQLVTKMYQNPRAQFNTDNSEALNNLGHDIVRGDFSDSPHLDI